MQAMMHPTEAVHKDPPFYALVSPAGGGGGHYDFGTGEGGGGGGLTALLRAMVNEDSRGSSVESSAGSGAKRSPNVSFH